VERIPEIQKAKPMKQKSPLKSEGSVILYECRGEDGIRRTGFELLINDRSRQKWIYETTELCWAEHGFETLVDAQRRNVLAQRQSWKPYNGHCRNDV
jgi:hypothetical protein